MLKFDRKKKKLVIPVGINPSYNIDSNELYNTTDANVVSGDIIVGKVAYGSDGKIIGSLDIDNEKQISFNEGVQSQKSKLESITIIENGTYSREDGYNDVIVDVPDLNGSYDEGYNDGVATQKSKLEGITITENGTYNKEDGYNNVVVNVPDLNGSYNEGYNDGYNEGNQVGYQSGYNEGNQVGYQSGYSDGDANGYNNGYSIGVTDGVATQKSKLEGITITENGTYNKEDGYNNVVVNVTDLNGSYNEGYNDGKTDGVVIGRNEIIEEQSDATITPSKVMKGYVGYGKDNERIVGDFEFTEGFDFSAIGYNKAESNECNKPISDAITYSKSLYDSIKPSSYGNIDLDFSYNNNLVYAPYPRTGTIKKLVFNNCKNLIFIPKYETNNLTDLIFTFNYCESLEEIPQIDTSNITDFTGTFYGCKKLKNIPLLDCGKVNTFTYGSASNRVFKNCNSLENLGGLKDLGKSFTTNQLYVYLIDSPNLTYSSLMNLINNLYDMTQNTSFTNTPTLYLHSTSYSLLSNEDIAIATSKGWTIQ